MKKLFTYLLASITAVTMIFSVACVTNTPDDTKIGDPEIQLAVKSTTPSSAVISATVKSTTKIKYAVYVKSKRPADNVIEWKEVAVAADAVVELPVDALNEITEYTIEAVASNAEKTAAVVKLDFKTLSAPSAITVVDIVGANNMISFKGNFEKGACDAFFYEIIEAEKYKESDFLVKCKPQGEGQVVNVTVKESGLVHKNQNGVVPKPNTNYIIAVVGAMLDGKGFWKSYVGAVATFPIKTAAIEVGKSDLALTFSVDASKTTFGGTEFKIARAAGSDIRGYYQGVVAKSVLGSKSIKTYVEEWLGQKMAGSFNDYTNLDNIRDFESANNTTVKVPNLDPNTPYVAFAVPYTQLGWLGALSSQEFSTKNVVINEDQGVELSASSIGLTDFSVDINWQAGYTKAYVSIAKKSETNQETTYREMQQRYLSNVQPDWTSQKKEHKFANLEPDTEYLICILAVKSDNSLGKVTQSITTGQVDFSSTATISVNVSKITYNNARYLHDHTIDITYNGATSCEFITVYTESTDVRTAKELATQMYSKGITFERVTAPQIVRGYEDTEIGSKVVFVPIDINGERGEPVMITIKSKL